jgi:hypothetical protein
MTRDFDFTRLLALRRRSWLRQAAGLRLAAEAADLEAAAYEIEGDARMVACFVQSAASHREVAAQYEAMAADRDLDLEVGATAAQEVQS